MNHSSAAAKPHTWWHWVSGNVTKEGITADLEAMKGIGLAGAQIFTVDQSNVKGPVRFMSPEWRELMHFAMEEAGRLNLELAVEGCDGWSESGAPWVTPAESMQKVVWSQRDVRGGTKISLDLPQPETIRNHYGDIGLFAFLWKEPFRVEITDALGEGDNTLAIKVTNLWPNRLIGDQKLAKKDRTTWASVFQYKADSPLHQSGLLGPVRLVPAKRLLFQT